MTTITATQGHRYQYGSREVIAMESGANPIVREILPLEPYPLGERFRAVAGYMKPLPMAYFHGETPA